MTAKDGAPSLMPCPFCGGPAKLLHDQPGGSDWWLVACSDMSCNGGPGRMMRGNRDTEIAAWNRRDRPDRPAQGCRECFPGHDCPRECVARNHAPTETTCRGADCPMACRWRGYTPASSLVLPDGGTWGHRDVSGYWLCDRYAPDLRPKEAKETEART
jgi:hypothetical protein